MNMQLPRIFLKVGETVFSVEQPPPFYKASQFAYQGYSAPDATIDTEKRAAYIQFVCDTVRTMLERDL